MERYIIALVLFLTGCASYDISYIKPTLLDVQKGKGYVYNTERIKPKPQCGVRSYKFVYAETIPMSQMAGYYCFHKDQVAKAMRDIDEAETKDCQKMTEVQNRNR